MPSRGPALLLPGMVRLHRHHLPLLPLAPSYYSATSSASASECLTSVLVYRQEFEEARHMLRDALLGESSHGCALLASDSEPFDPFRRDEEYWEHTQLVFALRAVKSYLVEQLQATAANLRPSRAHLESQ